MNDEKIYCHGWFGNYDNDEFATYCDELATDFYKFNINYNNGYNLVAFCKKCIKSHLTIKMESEKRINKQLYLQFLKLKIL